ncbi:MAG: tetratricopeptide repeat protein, partial [Candidatus Eremiobacteraeota bacterium]|nr:tetratricopeptide repeat protein [Candidatus Eremiobacteraeota bacterium]
TPLPVRAVTSAPLGESSSARTDYAHAKFTTPLAAGLQHFYTRDFKAAQDDFERALVAVPDNTLAISFLNAAAAQEGDALTVLTNVEEDAVSGAPKNYVNHVRLGFSYMFESVAGRDRTQDAREELNAAVLLDEDAPAAHVGLGILRFNERSANRAKTELLAALRTDPSNVLAREYLGQLYQTDLRDPQRGLTYVIDVPNLVPQYADISFHIGSLLHDLHQPQAAIEYLNRGIALDVDHVGEAGQHGYTLIARIYIEQHRLTDATKALDAAVASDTDAIYAKTLLAKIKSGGYDPTPGPDATPKPIGTK